MTRIAVVDDEFAIRELLLEIFSDFGWEMISIDSGDGAVTTVSAAQPDAVLLDLRLGGTVSGWQVLHQLKESSETRMIPVVLTSGAQDELDDKSSWLHDHGIAVVSKPFELDELQDVIEAALAGKTAIPYGTEN